MAKKIQTEKPYEMGKRRGNGSVREKEMDVPLIWVETQLCVVLSPSTEHFFSFGVVLW